MYHMFNLFESSDFDAGLADRKVLKEINFHIAKLPNLIKRELKLYVSEGVKTTRKMKTGTVWRTGRKEFTIFGSRLSRGS